MMIQAKEPQRRSTVDPQSPLRVFLILIVALLLAEFGAAFLLQLFPHYRDSWVEGSLDAFLTLCLASPSLYYLAVRPLQQQIRQRQGAEEELRQQQERLESLVQERTAELGASNQQLEREITERKQAEAEVRRHAEELRAGNEELARFNRAMVGRELRMVELKKEINELCRQAGQPPRYAGEHPEAHSQ